MDSQARASGTLRGGIWEGVLTGAGAEPDLVATHLDRDLGAVAATPLGEGRWSLRLVLPADLLTDGVQTVVIRDRASGARLDSFAIVCGSPLDDDLRAEIDLLRAELELLKRAFRRHVAEG